MTGLISKKISSLKGTAKVPGDKSISHRSLMFGALAEGVTTVTGLLEGEDVLCTAAALTAMGAAIETPAATGAWRIKGLGAKPLTSPRAEVYLGNSGTSARLLMGLAGGYPLQAVFAGDDSLSKRPMARVIKPLIAMGVKFETAPGDRLPLKITGAEKLSSIEYTLPVASAQVKSAILLAGLHAGGKTIVTEPSPTRDHTERMLRFLGADITSKPGPNGSNVVTLTGFPQLKARDFTVPSDPSSAAFLTVAALITKDSDVIIPNVSINLLRAGLYETLKEMGGDITFENMREASGEPVADIRARSSALKGVTVPPARVPSMIDEFPILSVAASFAAGKTHMSDLSELRVKESDRLAAIAKGLAQAGVTAEMGEDTLVVHGLAGAPEGGCKVMANLDHRIAMSFLVMGLAAKNPIAIDDAETIGTSFPGFADLMNSLGAQISAG
jgi:3-phosphoshikimate 1-carboxyvinyltransferase